MQQRLIFTNNVASELAALVESMDSKSIYMLADRNTAAIARELNTFGARLIEIPAGDDNKTLETAATVWHTLSTTGATRRSVMVNVGGGMATDLGGFAAAAFKRGIRFINVPTTLLGAVDAAVGGKTGVNFLHFKNEIGAFAPADAVVISTRFFASLPPTELRSGFAEMLKHGLISSADDYRALIDFDIAAANLDALLPLLERNVGVKRRIVEEDPREQGIRKALNLGHTAGHAFESLAMERERPVPHGYAVAHGLLVEAVVSHLELGFPTAEIHRLAALLRQEYAAPEVPVGCDDYSRLLALMAHDKKNASPDAINFTLLRAPGEPRIDCIVPAATIREALDLYRELLGR